MTPPLPSQRRGRHRSGYYLALLYALELEYRRQDTHHLPPSDWRPLPRNRPDQFIRWSHAALRTLGHPPPASFGELLTALRANGLPRVARAIDWAASRKLERNDEAGLAPVELRRSSLTTTLEAFGVRVDAPEAHPQARKINQALQELLDDAWRTALEQEAEGAAESCGAILLGGLPPGFERIFHGISRTLQRRSLAESTEDSSVLLEYTILTGDLPPLPHPWTAVTRALEALERKTLAGLHSLSERSRRQTLALSDDALSLLEFVRALRADRPERLVEAVELLSEEEFRAVTEFLASMRTTGARRAYVPIGAAEESLEAGFLRARWPGTVEDLRALRALLRTGAGVQVRSLDAEANALLLRGDIPLEVIRGFRDASTDWQEALHVALDELWTSTDAYLEDARTARRWLAARSPMQLQLREMFPRSVEWLDDFFLQNSEAILLESSDVVSEDARAFSRRVEERLLRTMPD